MDHDNNTAFIPLHILRWTVREGVANLQHTQELAADTRLGQLQFPLNRKIGLSADERFVDSVCLFELTEQGTKPVAAQDVKALFLRILQKLVVEIKFSTFTILLI
jgi:hypothetical protein